MSIIFRNLGILVTQTPSEPSNISILLETLIRMFYLRSLLCIWRIADNKGNDRRLDILCNCTLSAWLTLPQLFPLTQYGRSPLRTGQDKLDHLCLKIQNQTTNCTIVYNILFTGKDLKEVYPTQEILRHYNDCWRCQSGHTQYHYHYLQNPDCPLSVS